MVFFNGKLAARGGNYLGGNGCENAVPADEVSQL